MMKMDWRVRTLEPVALYSLLHKHALLPVSLGESRMMEEIKLVSENAHFGLVVEGDGDDPAVLASTLTYQIYPGVLRFSWIPECKRLHTRKDDLATLAADLRPFWFREGVRRVEAHLPATRTQSIRALKGLGFRQETLDCGLRAACDYGKGWEAHVVLGLLANDPVRQVLEAVHG